MNSYVFGVVALAAGVAGAALAGAPRQGVPTGCDPSVMSEAYWQIWNADEQAIIDADIEANRKADGAFIVDAPIGTEVTVEQLSQDFRFGAHIFNFNQLGKTEYNEAYKASYGRDGLFNQATVAFYWQAYEPTPGQLRAFGDCTDSEHYWNALSQEAAMREPYWRRPAPGPVISFLKAKDVAVHGHILIWGISKPYWIYDCYCPENEKRYFDSLGVPRHSSFLTKARAGAEYTYGFGKTWKESWRQIFEFVDEQELARHAPVFTANMRRLFRKRVADVARDFGELVDSWDVVNESSRDWTRYRRSKSGLPVWSSFDYGLMPGDYPLKALTDAAEFMSPQAKLAINDYNIGADFLAQVEDLQAEGARIDIVGCQMHIFNTNDCRRLSRGEIGFKWVETPQAIAQRLDMMAKTGKPLHLSEVTIAAPGADDASRQIQAILTRNIYRKWFSHRAMMGITWWNTVDGGGVYGEPTVSGLFTRDLQKKPAYHALDELINGEWKTTLKAKVKGEDDGRHVVAFRGFRGKYRLAWTCPDCGKTHTREVWLSGKGVQETMSMPLAGGCYRPAKAYRVDGKRVVLGDGESLVDFKKIYPADIVKGRDGTRWADVSIQVEVSRDGVYQFARVNDYYGRLLVNGEDLGPREGPWDERTPIPFSVRLKAGVNTLTLRTRSGCGGTWKTAIYLPRTCREVQEVR